MARLFLPLSLSVAAPSPTPRQRKKADREHSIPFSFVKRDTFVKPQFRCVVTGVVKISNAMFPLFVYAVAYGPAEDSNPLST